MQLHSLILPSIEADSIELRLIRLPDSTAIGAPDGHPV
jgi:hypothetical protein